jgi:hypothetical protein
MKYLKSIILLLFIAGIWSLQACGSDDGDPDPDPTSQLEEARQELLALIAETPWEPTSITSDGVDVFEQYAGFQLEVKDGTYRTINGGQAWPASGTWEFVEGSSNQFLRDDGVLMSVEVKGEDVEISFTFTQEVFAEGRTKTVQTFITFLLKQLAGVFGS